VVVCGIKRRPAAVRNRRRCGGQAPRLVRAIRDRSDPQPTGQKLAEKPMHDVLDITVTPLSPACGAEISGVDLTRELSAEEVRAIKDAWAKHLVLVFRGQTVSQDDQLRFAAYFGDLGSRKKAPEQLRSRAEGIEQTHEKVLLVSNIKVDGVPIGAFGEGEFWFHIDSGYSAKPYKYTFLYAVELPSRGGNTMFSNMYKAYEAVPAALKEKLRGRKALHIHEYNRAKQANHTGDISGLPHAVHPIFITHPDTGRKTLFVDRLMTTRIEGMSPAESDAILQQLYEIGERRELIFEHVWKLRDFLMWDNRCTIHARTDFPKEERRLLRRCAVEGEPLHEDL
jgi:alpha-ketoglutarate-dependent taurine dioxygenase